MNDHIDELLTRGISEFVDPGNIFRKKLVENPSQVIIKFGVDPTRPDIHIGHAVILRTLRKFQDLGCKVIFLVGDITSLIGDPTGKSKVRPEVSLEEIESNMNTYLEQVGRILRTENIVFDWTKNSDWFVSIHDMFPEEDLGIKMEKWTKSRKQKDRIKTYSFLSVLGVLRNLTLSRLIERDMFQERIKNNEPVFMHELLYPVLQGIDSSVLHDLYNTCDLEVGGTDQLFNMLVGRDVMEMNKKTPQSVLVFKIIEGLDGKEKMSKSLDNYIGITDEPSNMYGKVMSIPDSSILNYFELCTDLSLPEIKEVEEALANGANPKEYKMKLARELVRMYHGEGAAGKAEEDFITKFQKKEIPDDIGEVQGSEGDALSEILLKAEMIESKSDWRRLIDEGAVLNLETKEKIEDASMKLSESLTLKIGKKRFVKIILK